MAYLIVTYDKPNHGHVRDSARQKHLEYLEANVDIVLAGGGLIDERDGSVKGGMLLIDVGTRADAERFIAGDPFTDSDLFDRVEIEHWKMSFFDRKRVFPAK